MIETLRISGLAIVDEAELEFGPGLNVLTGETGAGKSIVLGALALLSGARADPSLLRDGGDGATMRRHPVTGRKALYVNAGFTKSIVDMKRGESKALLQFLFEHVKTPEFHCRFRWRANSVAVWDNRCVQHHALWDYYPQVRHGHRVTIKGDRPVA